MSSPNFVIRELREATPEVAEGLQELMNHLVDSPRPTLSAERLRAMVESPCARIFVAEMGGEIVGSLTTIHYLTPVSEKLWIEDVVVGPAARGMGVGRELVLRAVRYGREHFPEASICLTSNPSRKAARQLYVSVGFEEYNTGVFRLKSTT